MQANRNEHRETGVHLPSHDQRYGTKPTAVAKNGQAEHTPDRQTEEPVQYNLRTEPKLGLMK